MKKKSQKNEPILTHLDKVYWPKEGFTKGDLIDYYRQVSPFILPYLKDRPEALNRYPNGIEGPHFFQKDIDQAPPWVRTEKVQHEDHAVDYLIIDDESSLLFAANLGCIELNPFNSRIQSLYHPDYAIFDLDPEDIDFDKVIKVAQTIHKILEHLEIPNVCKTSGSRGLHICIPLGAQYPYEEVAEFSKFIAEITCQQLPDIVSLERSPSKRQKKVYIDYHRNHFGQTIAAAYCVRPKPLATVSTPLKWSEVKKGLDPTKFTMKTVLKRFEKVGDLFKPVLGRGINLKKLRNKKGSFELPFLTTSSLKKKLD